jgi:F5/8 type C domain-containing protein
MRVLDSFDDVTPWHVSASDDVRASLHRAAGSEGHALCMDFDFGAVSGYAVARRELPLEYPEHYEFSFGVRGDAPANTLQFKLVDASGQNVWWVNRPDYVFPREWQRVRFKERHIQFAWGPSKDRMLKRSAALELVIARGVGGGKGSVCFDRLAFRELPADPGPPPTPVLSATSTLEPTQPAQALDGTMATAWRSDPAAGPQQVLRLDFGRPREFGGLVLHWLPHAFASRYSIDFSEDGERWRTVRRVAAGNGGADPHLLPESETRFLRLRLEDGPTKAYGLAEIEIRDLAFGASPNAFFEALAKQVPRGRYPRAFVGEQNYWTVLGVDGGAAQGLFSEDGALEIGVRSGSVEPFLLTDNKLITWADVEAEQSLLDGYLPIPMVTWRRGEWVMRVTAFGAGNRGRSQIVSRYTLENRADQPRVVTLALAVRPFQVNPPTQFLNIPGGVAPIRELAWDGRALRINGERLLFPLQTPDRVVLAPFDAGDISELLTKSPPPARAVEDETGFASAVLLYRLAVPPRGSRSVAIVAPLAGAPTLPKGDATAWCDRQQAQTAGQWRKTLNRVSLHLPAAGRQLADTLRTGLAHILISRVGPALQPGTRAYARSWVRDGAMISDALLRLGHARVVREYAKWFAGHQFASGKVPCCVDRRGADPVAENDSYGELIHLIVQQYRYTHDRAWLTAMWPRVASAAAYMDSLRKQERVPENRTGKRRAFFGLMPPSISHEGYSDRPAYSYWDDFWTLVGYDDALEVAEALGRDDDLRRLANQHDEFRHDLYASLRASIAQHGIDYLPGSADRGDFDPTSTTIALSVAGQQSELPKQELGQTFERYWTEFLARRDGKTAWDDYTPYELRNVGAFVRLGWREQAKQLLDFFLAGRRPAGWNQWAEVVGREARQPRFLGDMPHGWVASDFIRSVLDVFAYEREEDRALVLAAGAPNEWLAGHGIGIQNLRTPYGTLSYGLRREGRRLVLAIPAGLTPPRGGLVFHWPYASPPGHAFANGHPVPWEKGRELRIRTLPAVITMEAPSEDSE